MLISCSFNVCTFTYQSVFVHPSFGEPKYVCFLSSRSPSIFVRLLPILLFLLLELPEMGLDGAGSLLNFNRAEWRIDGWDAPPVAGIGVWARQDTGYSHRGRGNSQGDIVCGNDEVQICAAFTISSQTGYFSDPKFQNLIWRLISNWSGDFKMTTTGKKNSLHLNKWAYLLFLYTPMLFLLRPSNCKVNAIALS